MTRTATAERWCSQHKQPRSECRPVDRHTQPLRTRDDLIAAVAARGEDIGLNSTNDALEMALEAWLRLPVAEIAEQALADRRIRRLPAGLRRAAKAPAPPPEPPGPAPATAVFQAPGSAPVVTAAVPDRKKRQR